MIRAYLFGVKSLEELLKMSLGVMGSRRGLRVVLDRENRVFPVLYALDGLVVEVQVCHFECFCARNAARFPPNRESVVL